VGGKLSVFREPSNNANGHTLDPKGRLVTCEHGSRRVTRTEKDAKIMVLADRWDGKRLNSPNDVAVRKDGAIFFTDPPYGIQPEQAELGFNGVYAIVEGKLKLLDKSFDRPNGLVFSPDQSSLYVADTSKGHIRRFKVAKDGALSGGEVWATTPNPDGLRMDSEERVWCASSDGVNVISPEGKVVEVIRFPEQPANLTFSKDGRTLYVTARTGVYSVKVLGRGLAP
jgi:gluconolactonase